jgi:hypothetical protein
MMGYHRRFNHFAAATKQALNSLGRLITGSGL